MNSYFHKCRREQGYVLLVLLLLVLLLSIGLLAMVEKISFQIKRDREEELIHRGVQYSRAVRKYVKMFGRYPNTVEALENTNNVRFLRKRYKDPITGKDFKFLHYGDLQTFYANTPPLLATGIASPRLAGPIAQKRRDAPPEVARSTDVAAPQSPPASDPSDASQPNQSASSEAETPSLPQPSDRAGSDRAPEAFGGSSVIGVASYSKDKAIRVFNKKDHYNQWQFVYDPSTDHVGLTMAPNQPLLKGAVQPEALQNGQGSAQVSATSPGQTNPSAPDSQAPSPQAANPQAPIE